MTSAELAFFFGSIFLDIGAFVAVGLESQRWNHIEFIFALMVSFLIIVQFLLRYLAITYLYKTETTIASWTLSGFILLSSLALIGSTPHIPLWFLIFGVLLILGSTKTRQTRKRVISAPIRYVERGIRLQESMISESAFGVFMILLFWLAILGSKGFTQLGPESSIFYGTLFALYYAIVSTTKLILALLRNRLEIQRHLERLQ